MGLLALTRSQVPVVAITGSPSTKTQSYGALVHHTLGTGDFSMFARMYEKVTEAQAYLTPENARAEIDRVLGVCLLKKLPVYITLPVDVATAEVAAPSDPLVPPVVKSDPATLALGS